MASMEEAVTEIAEYLQTQFDCGGTSYENMAREIIAMASEQLDSEWCPYDCGHCHQHDCGCSNCTGGE